MLSINKLTSGHARYYVDQAGDRVDAAETIGDGVEEYYPGPSTEPPRLLVRRRRARSQTAAVR